MKAKLKQTVSFKQKNSTLRLPVPLRDNPAPSIQDCLFDSALFTNNTHILRAFTISNMWLAQYLRLTLRSLKLSLTLVFKADVFFNSCYLMISILAFHLMLVGISLRHYSLFIDLKIPFYRNQKPRHSKTLIDLTVDNDLDVDTTKKKVIYCKKNEKINFHEIFGLIYL